MSVPAKRLRECYPYLHIIVSPVPYATPTATTCLNPERLLQAHLLTRTQRTGQWVTCTNLVQTSRLVGLLGKR